MSESPLILTWFVPPAPEALLALFEGAPATRWRSGEILQRETEPYDALYRIDEGVVGQAVINHALAKPVAMNLYAKHTVPGFLNLFSGLPSPRRLIVQQPGAVVRRLPKAEALERSAATPPSSFSPPAGARRPRSRSSSAWRRSFRFRPKSASPFSSRPPRSPAAGSMRPAAFTSCRCSSRAPRSATSST